jgi:tight adherence protein B
MMYFGQDITHLAFICMVAVAVGGVILALVFPMIAGDASSKRIKSVVEPKKAGSPVRQSAMARLMDGQKDNRRKQIQESLRQFEEREKQRKKKLTLRMMIMQSGLDLQVRGFWVMSLAIGAFSALCRWCCAFPGTLRPAPSWSAASASRAGFWGSCAAAARTSSCMISPTPSTSWSAV